MMLSELYQIVEKKVGSAFGLYGRFAARHAWKIIGITIIINLLLGIGLTRIEFKYDTKLHYLPQGSQALKDQERVKSLFPDLSATNFHKRQMATSGAWASVIVWAKTGNLLVRTALEEFAALDNTIQSITATGNAQTNITFSSICAITHGQCTSEGSVFWSPEFLTAVDNNNVTYPSIKTSRGTIRYSGYIGGNIQTNGTHLQGMEYIYIEYRFRTDGNYEDLAKAWCDKFYDVMRTYSALHIKSRYAHFELVNEELKSTFEGDIALIGPGILLMLGYACIATVSSRITDQVGQRFLLCFGGIVSSLLAVISGFGICAAMEVEFVNISGAVPYLIIGIGIDDMFILLSGLSGAQHLPTVEDKISETMRASAVGITITSLTDFIAFMAGTGSVFIAVRSFCIYAGVSVIFCYLNNVTLFCACMTVHERRVEQNRHFLTQRRVKTKEELSKEGKSAVYVMFCGGRPPVSREDAESMLDKFPRWIVPKLVLKLPIKIFIVIIFAGYLATAIYGCIHMRQGTDFKDLVSEDSDFYQYSDIIESNFPSRTLVPYIIDKTYQYSSLRTRNAMEGFIRNVQADPYFDDEYEHSWFKTYVNSPYFDGTNETAFITGLQMFLNQTDFSVFENDVIINRKDNLITASRFYVLSNVIKGQHEGGQVMIRARKLSENASFDCFPFSPGFIGFEQSTAIFTQTFISVGIALGAVFIVTCVFMPHPLLVILCTVVVLMIMTGVLGFMFYVDVPLSVITMVHVIVSIGFSVDFTAHICHGFMIADGDTRSARVEQAIAKTGAPIFHGAVSSLVALVVLFWAQTFIFRTFALVMWFVLLFGIAHALLLLPVILSWIGPSRMESTPENSEADKSPVLHRHRLSLPNSFSNEKEHRKNTVNDLETEMAQARRLHWIALVCQIRPDTLPRYTTRLNWRNVSNPNRNQNRGQTDPRITVDKPIKRNVPNAVNNISFNNGDRNR